MECKKVVLKATPTTPVSELLTSFSKTNRFNNTVAELAQLLNQTETVFHGSDLRMIYKITGKSYWGKEF